MPSTDRGNPDCTERTKRPENRCIDKNRPSSYLDLLQQFSLLNLHQKRQYLKTQASDYVINILRECLFNVTNGVVPCDKGLLQRLENHRGVHRLQNKLANHKEARILLCQADTLLLLAKILSSVRNFLSSSFG